MEHTDNSLSYDDTTIESLTDRFTALRAQECYYMPQDYLTCIRKEDLEEGKKIVDEKCRYTMAKWSYRILEFSDISSEICSTVMNNLDRFMSTEYGDFAIYDRHWFQLAVVCSLQIAIKVNKSCKLDMSTLIQIGKGAYNESDIIDMERELAFGLEWRLCPPTAYNFTELLLDLLPHAAPRALKKAILKLAKKQLYLATLQYQFIKIKPSLIAFASMLNAMSKIKHFPRNFRNIFIYNVNTIAGMQYCENIIHPIRYELHKILSNEMEQNEDTSNSRDCSSEQNSPVCVRQSVERHFDFK